MIDKNKQYRTRDGREVRIYATDGGGHRPIHGAIREDENWIAYTWLYDGVAALDCNSLIEVKPRIKREVWVNVYPDSVGSVCKTREEADRLRPCTHNRIACVKLTIDCEEGEGL
jgi:hypothetical protein